MLLLPMPWVANAAGLGRLAVMSSLGQPFRAEIDLVSPPGEPAALSSRIASPDAYEQADLQYGPALAGLRLKIKKRPDGQAYMEVTSSRPVNEPFIHLLIELVWDSTRIIRGYTALIDPPELGPVPVTSAPVAVPEAQSASEAQSLVSRRMTAQVEEKTAASKERDVVRMFKGESPNDIAADPGNTLSISYRLKILEETLPLRTKALGGLVERIAWMEETVQGMQRLLETGSPGIAAAQNRAGVEPLAQNPEAAGLEVVAAAEQEKSSIVGDRLFLAAGGGVILLGGLAYWMRRRRQLLEVTSEGILIKLLTRDPGRDDVRIKLLEIYAARKDKAAFHGTAGKFNKLTASQGEA
jgi:hypothetical protein